MDKVAATDQQDRLSRGLEQKIRAALKEIRFGTVTLVIQTGR